MLRHNLIKTIKHFKAQKYYTNIFYRQESKLREKIALGEFLEQFPRLLLEILGLTMITFIYGCSIFIEQINIPNFYFVTLIFASYLLVLLMVYFSTRLDLVYHLSTSANRVLEPLTLFLGFFSIYNLKTKLI